MEKCASVKDTPVLVVYPLCSKADSVIKRDKKNFLLKSLK